MELLLKEKDDALWLQDYFTHREKSVFVREMMFQNQKQYHVTISEADSSVGEIQNAIIHFIIIKKRNDWVKDILSDYYLYKEEEEKNHILEIVTDMFKGERKELTSIAGEVDEVRILSQALTPLIQKGDPISFDSFIKFRLKAYFQSLANYIEIAIDEYKMEQEYQVFVQMLRDYIQDRRPKAETVRIYFEEYGEFYNEHFEKMTRRELDEYLDRRLITNHPIYIDSVTIAPLLSMAPTFIYLYIDSQDIALIRTIKNIFEERVRILKKEEFWREKERLNAMP